MKQMLRSAILGGAIVTLLFATAASAKEVTIPYRGLTLNANLEMPDGKRLADGVILIVHGQLAHGRMETLAHKQSLLKEKGLSSLAINLSFSLDRRHGMYDCKVPHRHRHIDALDEIGAWLDWLEGQGVKSVTLEGHSRGANQVARFAVERDRPAIKALVLLAPGMLDHPAIVSTYEQRYKKPLRPMLERAESLVKAGKGDTMLERTDFLSCPEASVTAAGFVSYYSAAANRDTPSLLRQVRKPVLVIAGSNDDIHPDVVAKVSPIADGKQIQLKVIDGADAFFRDLYADDVVDAIQVFVGRL